MTRTLTLLTLAVVLGLLARNGLAIWAHVPLDPNEGWNAALALRWLAGGPLYPPRASLMVNNYPPLSFYLVAALTKTTGDAVVAGRIIALTAFGCVCAGLFLAARRMGARPWSAGLGALFFAAMLLVASDYVGIDDPQLLGHAVQMAALLALLRGNVVAAALLFAASLFIKHNLVALPLAAALWLAARDHRAAARFVAAGLAAGGAGLLLFQFIHGQSLLAHIAAPRLSSFANLLAAVSHLWWAALPLPAMRRAPPLIQVYAAVSLLLGLVFSAGDGVDANAFFDLAIALSLALALARPLLAVVAPLPLLAFLTLHWSDNNFFFSRDFAAQSARDIAFLQTHPGPALCSQLSLCLWAGKGAQVDVFNIGEAILSGARDPAALVRLIEARHFSVLQLDDMNALGPVVRDAIARRYRADHTDDNGRFLTPAP